MLIDGFLRLDSERLINESGVRRVVAARCAAVPGAGDSVIHRRERSETDDDGGLHDPPSVSVPGSGDKINLWESQVPPRPAATDDSFERPAIWGRLDDGTPTTLLGYMGSRSRRTWARHGSSYQRSINCRLVVFGEHLNSIDEFRPTSITLAHSSLPWCIANNGIRQTNGMRPMRMTMAALASM